MLRTYLENKQNQLMNQQVDFYTPGGIQVYFKDALENPDIDVESVVASVEGKIPNHLLSEIEMIAVGWFKEFEERNLNAFYKDAILHVSNIQDDEADMADDIIHEIAHAAEEVYGYDIYGDNEIRKEFLQKRERLHDELWALDYKTPKSFFLETEYNEEFDLVDGVAKQITHSLGEDKKLIWTVIHGSASVDVRVTVTNTNVLTLTADGGSLTGVNLNVIKLT